MLCITSFQPQRLSFNSKHNQKPRYRNFHSQLPKPALKTKHITSSHIGDPVRFGKAFVDLINFFCDVSPPEKLDDLPALKQVYENILDDHQQESKCQTCHTELVYALLFEHNIEAIYEKDFEGNLQYIPMERVKLLRAIFKDIDKYDITITDQIQIDDQWVPLSDMLSEMEQNIDSHQEKALLSEVKN